VAPNLTRHTQANYASILDLHVIPRIGDHRLVDLNIEIVSDLRAEMAADGVGDQSILKALTVLQSILQRAVEWRRIDRNPVRDVRKPSQARRRVVRPLSPTAVEKMRAYLLATDRADATLVAVLAYAGLRPGEAIGLRWHDLGERMLLIERSVAFGELKSTKTASTRSVRMLAPLKEDLLNWRAQSNRANDLDLISPPPTARPGTTTVPATGAGASSPRPPKSPTPGPTTCATASSA
jgi:integrase